MIADIDGRRAVLTSGLERSRIAAALPDAELLDFTALGMLELIEEGHSRLEAQGEVACRAVAQLGITAAVIPWDFPVAIADRLRDAGIELTVDDGLVAARRRVKSGAELAGVHAAQAATCAMMAAAASALARARPGEDGNLWLDGELLLAEDLRDALRGSPPSTAPPARRR